MNVQQGCKSECRSERSDHASESRREWTVHRPCKTQRRNPPPRASSSESTGQLSLTSPRVFVLLFTRGNTTTFQLWCKYSGDYAPDVNDRATTLRWLTRLIARSVSKWRFNGHTKPMSEELDGIALLLMHFRVAKSRKPRGSSRCRRVDLPRYDSD